MKNEERKVWKIVTFKYFSFADKETGEIIELAKANLLSNSPVSGDYCYGYDSQEISLGKDVANRLKNELKGKELPCEVDLKFDVVNGKAKITDIALK